jgi:hypothetical protein
MEMGKKLNAKQRIVNRTALNFFKKKSIRTYLIQLRKLLYKVPKDQLKI